MCEFEFDNGLECPNCGFTQTEESRHKKGEWFCFLCGIIWDPEKDYEEED